jgi:hypothetical protein
VQAARASYQHAVKCAIVDHQFGFEASRAVLAAANVQPTKAPPLVPQQGCVPLQHLPSGTMVVAMGGGASSAECSVQELGRAGFAVALADVSAMTTLSRMQLLRMIQSYYRCC